MIYKFDTKYTKSWVNLKTYDRKPFSYHVKRSNYSRRYGIETEYCDIDGIAARIKDKILKSKLIKVMYL